MRLRSRTRRANHYSFSIGTALGTVLPANNYREEVLFQNVGTAILNLGFNTNITGSGVALSGNSAVTVGGSVSALQLGTAATFSVDQHVGPIYAYAQTGSALISVIEFGESSTPNTSTGVYSSDIVAPGGSAYPGTPATGQPFGPY